MLMKNQYFKRVFPFRASLAARISSGGVTNKDRSKAQMAKNQSIVRIGWKNLIWKSDLAKFLDYNDY